MIRKNCNNKKSIDDAYLNISLQFHSPLLLNINQLTNTKMLQYLMIFSLFLIPSYGSYDYYTLSQQWPPTFCQAFTTNVCKPKYKTLSKFTIHGLWPSNYTGAHPRQCHSIVSMPLPV
jgi:ribonuclease I